MEQRFIYLHGFCSSPVGRKARYFKDAFEKKGVDVAMPDLNLPRFVDLTIRRQIGAVRQLVEGADSNVTLIGSSMGAMVALHYAAQFGGVEKLVLMAPALALAANLRRRHGEQMILAWRDNGYIEVPHYGYGTSEPIAYALYDDLLRYDSFSVDIAVPTLVLQGKQDELCPVADAERFARDRENVRLELFDADHRMHEQLDAIWTEMSAFLESSDEPT